MTGHHRRPVVRHRRRGEDLGLVVIAVLLVLAALTWLAGQISVWVAVGVWPSWRGVGAGVLGPLVAVYTQPADPLRTWPGTPAATPGPLLFWSVWALLLATIAAATITLLRRVPRLGGRPGFAGRRAVASRLGKRALLRQAARLRPTLTRGAGGPRPEQLGTHLGRDVNTGVECFASVRQSKYVVGPSESGKTSMVVIPEALDHDGPLVAVGSRTDVIAATWSARAERGRVWLFDPLGAAPVLPPVRWNLVAGCEDPTVAIRRAESMTASVDMSGVSDGDVWRNRGRAIFRNLLHAAAVSGGDVTTVLRWAYDQTSVEPASILRAGGRAPGAWAEMQMQTIDTPERQRAGYYLAVEAAMEPFQHPAVLDACTPPAHEDFDVEAFVASAADCVYVLAEREQASSVSTLLGAFLDEVAHCARLRGLRAENGRLDPPLRYLIDEAANTASLTALPSLVAEGAGRGVPVTVIVQDRAQAVAVWGQQDAQSMWGSASLRVVLPGVAGIEELQELAAYFGEYDEEIPTVTDQPGGHSRQYSLRTRQAMSTADVRSTAPQHAIVIAAGGLQPVLTKLVPYYRRGDAAAIAVAETRFWAALTDGRRLL